jgi:hypothetical protein
MNEEEEEKPPSIRINLGDRLKIVFEFALLPK